MPRSDLDLGIECRRRAPYRSLCVEVLMSALKDRRRGALLSAREWAALERWARRIDLSASILKQDAS